MNIELNTYKVFFINNKYIIIERINFYKIIIGTSFSLEKVLESSFSVFEVF